MPKRKDPLVRFNDKFTVSTTHSYEGKPCWIWTATTNNGGYGQFWFDSKDVGAHRWMYETLVGPIPEGLQIDHLCRVRNCINPKHLEPVTCGENVRRGDHWCRRKTHCPQGHPYDEDNTLIYRSGSRACKECNRERGREAYLKKKHDLLISC